jgi:DNA-binding Xre family transcriptional regulator
MSVYTFAVRELAAAHGDTTFYRLARRLKITDSRARQLWGGVTRMQLDTIALLCDAYGCTPNDFIKPVANGGKPARPRSRKGT